MVEIDKKMKISTIILAFLVIIGSVNAIEECFKGRIQEDIPCRVTTNYKPSLLCTNHTISLYDSNGNLIFDEKLVEAPFTKFCSWTFNQTINGTYYFNNSMGDAGFINVLEDDTMEFLNLTIFGIIFFFSLILVFLMHKYKEDEGSSIAYGFLAMALLWLMGSIIMFGFKVVELTGVTLPFDLNRMIGLVCFAFGLYSMWYSVSLLKFKKKEKNDFDNENEFRAK